MTQQEQSSALSDEEIVNSLAALAAMDSLPPPL